MKHLVKNYEIDIDCQWNDIDKTRFTHYYLERLWTKSRLTLFKEYNIKNRTKLCAAFATRTIWCRYTRSPIPNPKYNLELQYKAAKAIITAIGFEEILLRAFRPAMSDPFTYISIYIAHINISGNMTINATRHVNFHCPLTLNKQFHTKQKEIVDDLADI